MAESSPETGYTQNVAMTSYPNQLHIPPLADSILRTIGRTPLVALDRLGAGLPGRVLLKLEYFSPGHAVKDRVALRIIEDAERSGQLKPGQPVLELTSGNTGTGLAVVCAVKGYRLICVISEGNSPERSQMMRALGAEVHLVPQVGEPRPGQVSGADLAEVDRVAAQLTQELGAFRADQFFNPSNAAAHEFGTGAEIWEQTQGQVGVFLSTAGTGGSYGGVTRALKAHNPDVKCYVVEPAGAAFLGGQVTNPNHQIQGTGYMMELPQIPTALVDGYLAVTDDEAIQTARLLARREGIFGGFSAGANAAVALRLARDVEPGTQIVTLACDSGMKYLSTNLFSE